MKNKVIKNIAYDAMFIALIILFTFVDYLGYINIGFVSFTTIHILVLIGTSLFGWKKGLLYGFIMGLFSLLKAIQYPGTGNYFFLNPFISIIPRMIFGGVSGLVFDLLKKYCSQKVYSSLVLPASGVLTLFHTVVVVLFWYIFGILDPFYISRALGLGEMIKSFTFVTFVGTFISLGALFEIIASMVVTPLVYFTIFKAFKVGGVEDGNFKRKEEIKEVVTQ